MRSYIFKIMTFSLMLLLPMLISSLFNQTYHVACSGFDVIQRSPVPTNIKRTVIRTEILRPATKIINAHYKNHTQGPKIKMNAGI